MRTFKHFPDSKRCVLCGKSHDTECVLLPIDGTADGGLEEATPVHVECLVRGWFRFNPMDGSVGVVYGYVNTPDIAG